MRIVRLEVVGIVIALCVVLSVRRADAQEKQPDMQEMMKKWAATVKPGPHHKELEKFAGTWNLTSKMWMNGPNGPPVESKATSECKMILGGRYVQEEINGELKMPDMTSGQMKAVPWNAVGLYGYDNYRNMYTGVLVDNQSTMMLTMSGTRQPGSDTITYYGQMDEPMLNMVARTVKYVVKIESDTKHTFTIYDLAAGDNYKVVEVTYEKK